MSANQQGKLEFNRNREIIIKDIPPVTYEVVTRLYKTSVLEILW